ncbi:MAG TPA: hypothetical protein VGM05_12740, partial [Planctomycetaceae bacterium]
MSIAVVVVAASLAVADDNLDESQAIEKVEQLGGSVIRDDKLPGRPVIGVHLQRSKKFNDEDMRLLVAFPSLTRLMLNRQITNVGVKELGRHKNLTELEISGAQITDTGLIELRELKKLTILGLNGTQITDAGLREFREFKNLTTLLLGRTKITDAGLGELKELKKLTTLGLGGT